MKVLVNGSCFNRGGIHGEEPGWVDLLSDQTAFEIDNYSMRSAGIDYTVESTVAILTKQKYDAVIIVWPQIYKVDLKTVDPMNFPDHERTSYYISRQIERASLINPTRQHIDHLQFDQHWVFNQYPSIRTKNIIDTWYSFLLYTDHKQVFTENLLKIYMLQQHLKSLDIPFLFYFGKYSSFAAAYQKQNKLFDERYVDLQYSFMGVAKKTKAWNKKLWKSGIKGHQMFSKIVQYRLTNLLKQNGLI